MMLNRRVARSGPSSHLHGSMSRAQFHTAVETYQSFHQPANRLVKSSMTSNGSYGYYENTARNVRHSGDVCFPPVYRTSQKSANSPRRPAKRAGTRKLPSVKTRTSGGRKLALFHEDGTVNLEALAHLGKRQSFPRTQSSYDRLGRIGHRTQRTPSAAAAAAKRSSRSDVDGLIPLQFVDDDQLTPRRRAERDSFLATLLKADDLTDEELNEIAHYLIPDDLEQQEEEEEEESTPRPCLKKSRPRPKSAVVKAKGKGTAMNSRSLDQSARPKSVRFLTTSPLPLSEPRESSPPPPSLPLRPQSSPGPSRSELKPSDPFHVASPLPSPRSLDSPDEVAYFHRIDSPPLLPASQELMPEPEVTYYDDAGEKIEEEPLRRVHGSDREKAGGVHGFDGEKGGGEGGGEGEGKGKGPGQCEESSSPRPAGSTPRSESSKRSASPASEPDSPERGVPEPPDTPRGEREAVATQSSPRSDTPSGVSSSVSPRQQGLPGSSQSTPRQSSPPPRSQSPTQRESTSPHSDVKLPSGDSPATEGTSPCPSSTAPRPDSSAQSDVASPTHAPRSESAPNEESPPPRPSKKLRPKSGKRKKSPPECLPKPAEQNDLPAPQERSEKETSPRPEQSESPPQGSPASPRHSPPVQEEPLSIPVISVTRGQLPSVPPRSQSPLVQASDTLPLGSADGQPQDNAADSLPAEGSSLPNTTREADASSSMVCSASSREKGRRKKDERMKIWLTKTSWDRHVECAE